MIYTEAMLLNIEEFRYITRCLPNNWMELASSTGAIRRCRQVDSPETLMRLLLMHASGLSLRQTVTRARLHHIADLSDVALMKRMNKSAGWILSINSSLIAETNRPVFQTVLPNRKLFFVDGTHTTEPDGSYWRVHYQFSAESLGCNYYSLTKSNEAESFTHFPVHPGDLLLGDRAYCKAQGIRHVVDGGGDVLVRMHLTALPLWDENGQQISLLPWLRMINHGETHDRSVIIHTATGPVHGRICAKRLSLTEEMKSKRRIKKTSKKKQKKAGRKAVEYGGFICIFTTVPANELSAKNALEIYRARWQVEIAFKRLKSLLKFGSIPKDNNQAAIAWIHLKLLLAFIIERYVASIRSSLVTTKGAKQKSLWRVWVEVRDAIFHVISIPIRMDQLLSMDELIATAHTSPPRRRQPQLDELRRSMAA
jgi:hypothetical protein